MPIVQTPRFVDLLRRALNVKEGLGLRLAEDILGVVPLYDANAPEMRSLRGEQPWMSAQTAAAVPGNVSFVRLENPSLVSAPLLVVVDRVFLGIIGTVTSVRLATSKALGVGSTVGQDARPLDGRRYDPGFNGVDCRQGSRAVPNAVGVFVATANPPAPSIDNVGAVLPPGWALEIEMRQVNTQLEVGFFYRIRSIESSEL